MAIKEITDRITDIEFHMITMRFSRADAADEKIGNVQVHRVEGGSSYFSKILFIPRAVFKARKLNQKEKFEGAWAMMSYMVLPLLFVRLPYALTLQEGDTEQHMFGRLRVLSFLPLINRGFKKARVVSAISTYLGGWARKRGFRKTLELIPNGVDIQKFAGERAAHEGTVLITASRLVHKNGIDTIIRALPLLPDITFVVCGIGPDEKKLQALARELGVAGRVLWRGHVDHNDLPRHLHHADIFIRPSRSEGMGNSFVEAFAAGIPVIATQEGGLADFITSEVAWPVKKDSPDQIALQVKAILSNPEHTQRVIENAKQLVKAKYDWSLIACAMREKIFARLFIA